MAQDSQTNLTRLLYIMYMKSNEMYKGSLSPFDDPFLREVIKSPMKQQGLEFKTPVKTGWKQSSGPDAQIQFDIARANIGTGDLAVFTQKWDENHSWNFISEKVQYQTLRRGGYWQELLTKINEARLAMKLGLLRDVWGYGQGYLGKIKTISKTSTTVTITVDPQTMALVTKNTFVEFSSDASNADKVFSRVSGGTGNDKIFEVTVANPRTNTIVIDGVPAYIKTVATALAVGNFLFNPGGAGVSRTKGALAYVPSTLSSTDNFYGVNRSTSPALLTGSYKNVTVAPSSTAFDWGTVIWKNLVETASSVQDIPSGEMTGIKRIYCHFKMFNRLTTSKFFTNNIRWENNEGRDVANLGVGSVNVTTSRGKIPIVPCQSMPDYHFFGTDPKKWKFSYLSDSNNQMISFATDDKGSYIMNDESKAYRKFRLKAYTALTTGCPMNNFLLKFTT